jgi:Leucine-rich repeat (LRR) protein
LALFNTGISGEISDLSNLQKLEVFKIENCDLTGDGFMSLYNVPHLKVLGVAGNPIVGSLEGVDKLLILEELYIGQTSIRGTLPQGMGNMHQLKYIKSSETSLTGAIPTSLGNLKNLIEMDFSINQFTGVLPTEFGALASLKVLDLSRSGISGGIPSEIGSLKSLTNLVLFGNELTGRLLCKMIIFLVTHGQSCLLSQFSMPAPPSSRFLSIATRRST